MDRRKLIAGLLLVAGLVAYGNSMSGVFTFDDDNSILQNPHICRLWPLSWSMGAPVNSTVAGRPVVSLTLAVNYAISGLKVWSYHVFNLAVHLVAALALFGLVRRTLVMERFGKGFEGGVGLAGVGGGADLDGASVADGER